MIAFLRNDPKSLVPAARAMYEVGKTTSEVLRAIYGVDLPQEAYAIRRAYVDGDHTIHMTFTTNPWELMIPLEEGGPAFEIGPLSSEDEARAYARAPHVLPVGFIHYFRIENGFVQLGYDLEALAAGKSTVVGIVTDQSRFPDDQDFNVIGDSLLDVFGDFMRRYLASWGTFESPDAYERRADIRRQIAELDSVRSRIK